MRKTTRYALAAALTLVAVPLAGQNFSESFQFLKAIRDRNAQKVQEIASRPNPAVINTRDSSSGEGALHILVRGRDLTWLRFLLSRGARPDLAANDGTTPLILAAQLGWIDGAEALIARGANVNLGNRGGETPLIMAVQGGNLPMVRMLLAQGADPDQTDNVSGNSAVDYARQDRRLSAILRELETPRR
ncbi:MAG TPA: ankyrin repeat domain-containing protein [Allosphingosinicella sp.]|jgi:ankyrin repeat protein